MKYCIRTMTLLISVIIIGCKGIEVQYGKSSLDSHPVDSDGDMLTDFEEKVFTGTDGHNADTDGDGLPDGWEWFSGLDPLCSYGLDGPDGDPNNEGTTNLKKYLLNPNKYKRGAIPRSPEAAVSA